MQAGFILFSFHGHQQHTRPAQLTGHHIEKQGHLSEHLNKNTTKLFSAADSGCQFLKLATIACRHQQKCLSPESTLACGLLQSNISLHLVELWQVYALHFFEHPAKKNKIFIFIFFRVKKKILFFFQPAGARTLVQRPALQHQPDLYLEPKWLRCQGC